VTVNEDLLVSYLEKGEPLFKVYEPGEVMVVLGAGRRNKNDLLETNIRRDGIKIHIRKGGGGTVILSPGMLVLALITEVSSPFRNREYTLEINGWIRELLEEMGVRGIQDRGISDLALRERKILGTTLYRKQRVLFYQASLLVSNDLSLLSRYLTLPDRVPEYRRDRSHEEFCTTIHAEGYPIDLRELLVRLDELVRKELPSFR
jgi:lipoate-protein ligase A